jgi:hypothetical protein
MLATRSMPEGEAAVSAENVKPFGNQAFRRVKQAFEMKRS